MYLNWTSLTSRKYKISLIYCLCDRIWKICQETTDRDLEFKKLKQTLLKNEYPEHIINQEIEKFITKRTKQLQQQALTTATTTTNNQQPPTIEKQKKYIVLPYSNKKVDAFAEKLTKLVNDTFEQVDLKIAFKAPNEIGKMFPFKDNNKKTEAQSLVYKITCETCGQSYIGQTQRILSHRIKEHNKQDEKSAIQTHKKQHPTHVIDANNIEIIDKADSRFKILVKAELNTQHAATYKNNKKELFKTKLNTIIIAYQS